MKRKILCVCLSLFICLSVVGCGSVENFVAQKSFRIEHQKSNPESFVAAENEKYSLKWDNEKKSIVFYDKQKQIPWSYLPYQAHEKKFDEDGYEITNHPQVASPLLITYLDSKKNVLDMSVCHNESVKKNDFTVGEIENGISITYFFSSIEISITVDYLLKDDNLEITVDPKKITENNFLVVDISIAPFFCSVPNKTEDSYLFVPSGTGALVYADKASDDVINISEEVYGPDAFAPDDGVVKTVSETVKLPVYGAKNDNVAVMAIIKDGAEATSVNVTAQNNNFRYSSVYAVFNVRKSELMITNNGQRTSQVYSEGACLNPVTIGYYPLYDDQADYMGMALKYRDFLSETEEISSDIKQSMLNLQFLGGTMITESVLGVPHNTIFATTTIEETDKIIRELTEETAIKPAVQLLGYGETGLDIGSIAGGYAINKKIGTKKQLKKLNDYCTDNGIKLFFDFEALQFKKSSSQVSKTYDTAKTTNGRKATMYYYNNWSGTKDSSSRGWNNKGYFYLLKRELIPEIISSIGDVGKDFGLDGISFGSLSSIAYSDYSEQKYYSKNGIQSQVSEQLKALKKKDFDIATKNSNLYAAVNSNYLFDVPRTSSQYDIFDVDVPVYQLVFSGMCPMASKPINTDVNSAIALLHAVETGTGITYTISNNYTEDLIYIQDVRYYGSHYSSIKSDIISTVKENKNYYNAIANSSIVDHEIVSETVRKTVFDNGVTVYVNYGQQSAETPVGTVNALSYVFTKGEQAND